MREKQRAELVPRLNDDLAHEYASVIQYRFESGRPLLVRFQVFSSWKRTATNGPRALFLSPTLDARRSA